MSGRGLTIIARADGLRCSFTSPMASVMTSEFIKAGRSTEAPPFALIEQKGIVARLVEEVARAAGEIARDPRGFIQGLVTDETRDKKRQRQMRLLLAGALVFHLALLGVIVVAGWHAISKKDEPDLIVKEWIKPTSSGAVNDEPGSSKPESGGEKSSGGDPGGGGQRDPRPANKGVLPQQVPNMLPAKFAPTSAPPVLPVPQTIQGPLSQAPPLDVPIGLPGGEVGVPPSPGPGNRGGIGSGDGPGAGPGSGPTAGTTGTGSRGSGPDSGDGSNRPGGIGGPIDWNRLKQTPGHTDVKIVRPIRAITTPEAQANKVSGVVVFRVTVNADGTISDIELISTVPYMDKAAEDALRKSTFRPATVNGAPITVRNVLVRIKVGLEERL